MLAKETCHCGLKYFLEWNLLTDRCDIFSDVCDTVHIVFLVKARDVDVGFVISSVGQISISRNSGILGRNDERNWRRGCLVAKKSEQQLG